MAYFHTTICKTLNYEKSSYSITCVSLLEEVEAEKKRTKRWKSFFLIILNIFCMNYSSTNSLECSKDETNGVYSKRKLICKSLEKEVHTENVNVASADWYLKDLIKCLFMACGLMYLTRLTPNNF